MSNVNVKAIITAEDRASSVLRGFSDSVSSMGQTIVTGAKVAATALTAVSTAAAVFGVKAAADFQQTRIAFEGILGSAGEADKMLKQLRDFAAKTPFELPGLLKSTQQLLATGTVAEDVIPTMTILGNVTAALGKGENEIQGVVRALGQMKGKGKAAGQELLQISEQLPGFSAINAIAKDMGVSVGDAFKLMEKGAVPADRAITAILKGMKEFPGASNAMERQSKTLNGIISTVKDTFRNALIDGIEPFLPGVADSIGKSIPYIEKFVKTSVDGFSKIIKDIMPTLKQWTENIRDVAKEIGNYLGPKLETLYNTLKDDVIPAVSELAKQIGPALGAGLVGAIGLALDALNGILKFMSDHTEVVLLLATAIVSVKTALFLAGAAEAFTAVMTVVRGQALLTAGTQGVGAMSGSLASFATLATTPIFLPALVITAVLASVALMVLAVVNAKNTIEGIMNEARKKIDETSQAATEAAKKVNIAPTPENKKAFAEAARRDYIMRREQEGLTGRAHGGPITGGTPYLVGEQGPEIVVPRQNGIVIPNNKINQVGSSPINITIKAGAFMGTQMEARKFAQMIMGAYDDAMKAKGMAY